MRRVFAALCLVGVFAAGIALGERSAVHAQAASNHVFEVRIYTAGEGKLDAVVKRFRNPEVGLFEKYGMKAVLYSTVSEPADRQNQFVYVQSALSFAGPLVALALLSHTSGLIALVGYVVIGAAILRFDKALMVLARQENDADRRYAAALLDFVGNASTVIGLRLQAASARLLRRRMEAVSAPLKRAVVVNEGKWFAVDMLGLGLTWLLVAIYVWQAISAGGTASAVMLGTVFMIYQYAQQAASVVSSMAANFQNFARMHTDFGSAEPIWAAPGDPAVAPPPVDAGAHWTPFTFG